MCISQFDIIMHYSTIMISVELFRVSPPLPSARVHASIKITSTNDTPLPGLTCARTQQRIIKLSIEAKKVIAKDVHASVFRGIREIFHYRCIVYTRIRKVKVRVHILRPHRSTQELTHFSSRLFRVRVASAHIYPSRKQIEPDWQISCYTRSFTRRASTHYTRTCPMPS